MRNLVRPLLRLLGRDDRGAIGIMVAVLLGGGVLLGMAAMVVDVGQIYQNRAELQNGADAAALAIARQCQQGACPANPVNTAGTYASANASALTQGAAGVACVLSSDFPSSPSTPNCPAGVVGTGLTNCPPDPGAGTHFVDVLTDTKLGNGSTLLPPVFAETFLGKTTYDGTSVKACAQAEWGPPSGIAFTISECEFNTAMSNPANGYWNPTPPYSASDKSTWPVSGADSAYDKTFTIHSGSNNVGTTSCSSGPASQDAPGAFAWTNDPLKNCQTPITTDPVTGLLEYGVQTGTPAKDCKGTLQTDLTNHTPVFVPVYNAVGCCGSNTEYTFAGFASFVITGLHVDSLKSNPGDWLNGSLACSSPIDCINGFFTSGVLSQTLPPGSPDSVKLTG